MSAKTKYLKLALYEFSFLNFMTMITIIFRELEEQVELHYLPTN